MSSLFSSNGYFTPTQLKTLEAFLDNVTVSQTVSAGDRERLAKVVIALAQSHLDTDAELSRLLKAASCVLLELGSFPSAASGQSSLPTVIPFRREATAPAQG